MFRCIPEAIGTQGYIDAAGTATVRNISERFGFSRFNRFIEEDLMIKTYVAAALLGPLAGGAAFAQTATPASPSPAPAASASVDQTTLKGSNWRASS
jgi:hypothetical protein